MLESFVALGFVLVFGSETVTYEYDALGRLIAVNYENDASITYTYDDNGNRTQVIVDQGTRPNPSESANVAEDFILVPAGSAWVLMPND